VLGCRWRMWGEQSLAASPPPGTAAPSGSPGSADGLASSPVSDAAASESSPSSGPARPPRLPSLEYTGSESGGSVSGTPSRMALLAPTPLSCAVDEECYWTPQERGQREELEELLESTRGDWCYGPDDEDEFVDAAGLDDELQACPASPSGGLPLCASSLESLGSESSGSGHGDLLGPARPMRPRRRPGAMEFVTSPPPLLSCMDGMSEEAITPTHSGDLTCHGVRRPRSLNLATPSSSSSMSLRRLLTPGTPQPDRSDLKLISGDVGAVFFDFDGTLTASPGDRAQRCRKQVELSERAPLLAPRLKALREAGIILAIISKSSEATIVGALECAGLRELFDGPLIAKAIGLEGKAGFIEEICRRGCLNHLGVEHRALLVDDDVRELDRARSRGIQTYAAPKEGGLQDEDFDEIFAGLSIGDFKQPPAFVNGSGSSMVSTIPPSPLAACGSSLLHPETPHFSSPGKSPNKKFLVPELPELPELALEEAAERITPQ